MADKGIGHDLERQRRERLIVRRAPQFRVVSVKRRALDRRNIHRRRQIINDRVEQGLHAFVFERGTCDHRHQLQRNRRAAQRGAQLGRLQLVLLEILGENGVVVLRDVLDHFFAMLFVEFRTERSGLYGLFDFGPRVQKLRVPEFFKRQHFIFRA